jgi:myo-inositol-1(or 4)-monophosphatase
MELQVRTLRDENTALWFSVGGVNRVTDKREKDRRFGKPGRLVFFFDVILRFLVLGPRATMKPTVLKKALNCSIRAARTAGDLIRRNHRMVKKVNDETQHDIKLELDVRCQKLIEKTLVKEFPQFAVLGEEGISGDKDAACRWVIDPIDGTVNFTYGIPHVCVSIALQERVGGGEYQTVVGLVYDPFCDEMWTAIRGQQAKLNNIPIHASKRSNLSEAIVSIGFAKSKESLDKMLPYFNEVVPRIRKIRMMGAAALALTYVASGRFDAYVEGGIRLWDIAAGGLILECAGGEFWNEPIPGDHAYRVLANNGLLRSELQKIEKQVSRRQVKK